MCIIGIQGWKEIKYKAHPGWTGIMSGKTGGTYVMYELLILSISRLQDRKTGIHWSISNITGELIMSKSTGLNCVNFNNFS